MILEDKIIIANDRTNPPFTVVVTTLLRRVIYENRKYYSINGDFTTIDSPRTELINGFSCSIRWIFQFAENDHPSR